MLCRWREGGKEGGSRGWRGRQLGSWAGGWAGASKRVACAKAPPAGAPPPCPCRDILAIPETRADWWLFYDRHLKERLAAGALKISLVNSDHAAGGGS